MIVLLQAVKWEARPAATAWMGERQSIEMANGHDRPVQIVIVGDDRKVAEMYVLKPELDGCVVTVLRSARASFA